MITMNEEAIERVATTRIVRRVLDEIINRPFSLWILFYDMAFLFILWYYFWRLSTEYLVDSEPKAVSIALNVISICYFVFRELSKFFSNLVISTDLYWNKFKRIINLIDLFSIIFVVLSMLIVIRVPSFSASNHTQGQNVTFTESDNGASTEINQEDTESFFNVSLLLAVTQLLLCFKVLGFMRMINVQLATFVLAIIQIIRDTGMFLSVLLIVLLGFTGMFATMNEGRLPSGEKFVGNDVNQILWYYFKRLYLILLGEFEISGVKLEEHFWLFIVFTFFAIIILLNVLIAIVGDSYDMSFVHSQKLFGRARVESVAELVALEQYIKPTSGVNSRMAEQKRKFSKFRPCSIFILCTIISALLFCCVYTITQIGKDEISINAACWFDYLSVAIVVALLLGQMTSLVRFTYGEKPTILGSSCSRLRNNIFFAHWMPGPALVQAIMRRLLGTSTSSHALTDEWLGRIRHIERQTRQVVTEFGERFQTDTTNNRRIDEARMQAMEARLTFAIKNLSDEMRRNAE